VRISSQISNDFERRGAWCCFAFLRAAIPCINIGHKSGLLACTACLSNCNDLRDGFPFVTSSLPSLTLRKSSSRTSHGQPSAFWHIHNASGSLALRICIGWKRKLVEISAVEADCSLESRQNI
jgi:hypothetical protein